MALDSEPRRFRPSEIINYGRNIPYPSTPDVPLPSRPEVQVRGAGFLGLGLNNQDLSHQRRMTELYHVGLETVFTEAMAMGFEASGLAACAQAMQKAEE